jgi:hypothetical protein
MATAKQNPGKRSPAKKAPAKRAPGKKAPARLAPAKKAPARKMAPAKTASVAAKTRSPKGKVWEYIKKNDLQDKAKRPAINPDARTKP